MFIYFRNDIVIENIMKLYPNGIKDIINEETPKENEPQIILFFNSPSWFCNKYGDNQTQSDEFTVKDIIKGSMLFLQEFGLLLFHILDLKNPNYRNLKIISS